MTLLHGDCLERLKEFESDSVDALVTDPPAGISFMGKGWDSDLGGRLQWIGWMTLVMAECNRVMKPGAHGLVWALPRTSHWTATALEDAGFEIRDCVYHLFGSGFPKSLDVSKALDKAAGAEREVVGQYKSPEAPTRKNTISSASNYRPDQSEVRIADALITAPATDAAKQWAGWGTALKPAVECWWLVRKPLSEKTVAANVLRWGTGALNIDGGRIVNHGKSTARITNAGIRGNNFAGGITEKGPLGGGHDAGRFPANLLLSCACEDDQHELECAVKMLDEQSLAGGMHGAGKARKGGLSDQSGAGGLLGVGNHAGNGVRLGDSGGASRFFYCAKVSASERNAGLEGMPDRLKLTQMRSANGTGEKNFEGGFNDTIVKNHHPTVKPQKLMRYLAKLVTPPGGTILDPFTGSGSTGCAAVSEGFQFVGIEREAEYLEIAKRRIFHAFPEFKKQVQP